VSRHARDESGLLLGRRLNATLLASKYKKLCEAVADREGFEPSVGFHLHTLSKRARSTTPPPVRFHDAREDAGRSFRREAR
jgi:hypothetical protein